MISSHYCIHINATVFVKCFQRTNRILFMLFNFPLKESWKKFKYARCSQVFLTCDTKYYTKVCLTNGTKLANWKNKLLIDCKWRRCIHNNILIHSFLFFYFFFSVNFFFYKSVFNIFYIVCCVTFYISFFSFFFFFLAGIGYVDIIKVRIRGFFIRHQRMTARQYVVNLRRILRNNALNIRRNIGIRNFRRENLRFFYPTPLAVQRCTKFVCPSDDCQRIVGINLPIFHVSEKKFDTWTCFNSRTNTIENALDRSTISITPHITPLFANCSFYSTVFSSF